MKELRISRSVVEKAIDRGLAFGGPHINVGHAIRVDDVDYIISSLRREGDDWVMELEPAEAVKLA